MSKPSLFEKVIPFVSLGILIVIAIFMFIVGLYILFYGAIIGLILLAAAYLKNKLFGSSSSTPAEKRTLGKTYDNDDFKGE